jgi:hypothetical protein
MKQPKQLNSQEYRELLTAHSQSEILKERAQYVLIVDEKGNELRKFANRGYQVGVLAVLGPVSFGGVVYDEALWFEIGIGPSGPYRKSYGFKGVKKITAKRKRRARSLENALAACLPSVEEILVGHTHMVRSRWRSDVECINTNTARQRQYRRGVRFHVSLGDTDLLSVVVHSEIACRQRSIGSADTSALRADTVFQVEIVARKMSGLLRVYGDEHFSREWFRQTLRNASKRQWQLKHVIEWLQGRRFLPHQFYLILQAMQGRQGEELFRAVLDYLGVYTEEVQYFGSLVERKNTPTFSENIFVYCPSRDIEPALGNYRKGRRKRDANGSVVYDRFTFEVIPREETRRDPLGLGGTTLYCIGDEPPF